VIVFTAKDVSEDDKKRLGSSIESIVRKSDFSKEDLFAEIRLLELAYPEKAKMMDGETGLFNRRYFDTILPREIARADRYGQPFSILLIDVDRLKSFNAVSGRAVGDAALRELADMLKDNIRKADCLVRFAGDEFALILSGLGQGDAVKAAEKIRGLVEARDFKGKSAAAPLSVSIAVVTYPDVDADNLRRELFRLKKKAILDGGNQVLSSNSNKGAE
jgi:diguanylate cyclase (GGDEF)-like protein